jgi:hypothetical protein
MLENKRGKYAESFSELRIACKSHVYEKMENFSIMNKPLSGTFREPFLSYHRVHFICESKLIKSVGALLPRTGSRVQKLKVLSPLLYHLLVDKEISKCK